IPAPSLTGLLDPAAGDPVAILELVEQGIERGDVKGQQPARFAGDFTGDVVAMELAVLERGEDQDLGAAFSRRRVNDRISHIWESYISRSRQQRFQGVVE